LKDTVYIDKVKIRVIEPGIIENYFRGDKTIEVDDIVELRKVNLRISDGKPYVVLVEAEDLISFSKETREFIASQEFMGITMAKALLFKSLAQRIIGNFYLHINKPHIKTRLFNDRAKALEWLRFQASIKVEESVSSDKARNYFF
jgi:hypothetical protein